MEQGQRTTRVLAASRAFAGILKQATTLKRNVQNWKCRVLFISSFRRHQHRVLKLVLLCIVMLWFVMVMLGKFNNVSSEEESAAEAQIRYPQWSKLFTLANQVGVLLQSMSLNKCPFDNQCVRANRERVLVHTLTPTTHFMKLYASIIQERLIGGWKDDIVVVTSDKLPHHYSEALLCLNARVEYIPRDLAKHFTTDELKNNLSNLWPLATPRLRRYEYIFYLPVDFAITDPMREYAEEDFRGRGALFFLAAKGKTDLSPASFFVDEQGMFHSGILEQNPYFVMVNRLPTAGQTSALIHKAILAGRDVAASSQQTPPSEKNHVTKLKRRESSSELAGFFSSNVDDHFMVMTAARFLSCPALYVGMDSHVDQPPFTPVILKKLAKLSLPWLQAGDNFKKRFLSPKPTTLESRPYKTKRVLVVWASKDFVDGGYSVLYSLRTIGMWDEDLVLLTDGLSESNREALECLNVRTIFYSPTEFAKTFPWVKGNVWYLKLLPFILPELRGYDIIQYLDLDIIVTGPIMKRYVTDFEDGVTLLMEDNGWDESIIRREFMLDKLSDVDSFIAQFPGADDKANGPNQSPSAGACFHAVLVSRLEPIDALIKRFVSIAKVHADVLVWGDQPLLMLAFWGRWRMRFGHNDWQTSFPNVFHPLLRHELTKQPIRYVHTGGSHRPPLPTSPYKPIDSFTRILASETLGCASLGPVF